MIPVLLYTFTFDIYTYRTKEPHCGTIPEINIHPLLVLLRKEPSSLVKRCFTICNWYIWCQVMETRGSNVVDHSLEHLSRLTGRPQPAGKHGNLSCCNKKFKSPVTTAVAVRTSSPSEMLAFVFRLAAESARTKSVRSPTWYCRRSIYNRRLQAEISLEAV